MDKWGQPIAFGMGLVMVLTGASLAALGRPEPALIWAGAALAAFGLVGDRIRLLSFGGAKMELEQRRRVITQKIDEVEDQAIPLETGAAGDQAAVRRISGSLWSDAALDAIVRASLSDAGQARQALRDLDALAAQGTAVVRVSGSGDILRAINDVADSVGDRAVEH